MELPINKSIELVWSNYLGVSIREDGTPETEEFFTSDYLFRPERFSIEFWTLSEELAQLNDFCVMSLYQTERMLRKYNQELSELASGDLEVDHPLFGYQQEVIDYLEIQIESWNDTYEFLARAMCLMMLSAFTEKSLKSLSKVLSSDAEDNFPRNPGESKVAWYIRFLGERCSIAIDEPEESKFIRNRCRRVRNAFAHGDWDVLRQAVGNINLRDAFRSTALLLNEIEDAAWDSPWGKQT